MVGCWPSFDFRLDLHGSGLPQLSLGWKAGHYKYVHRGLLVALKARASPKENVPMPAGGMPSFRKPRKLGQPRSCGVGKTGLGSAPLPDADGE
jgi:hypothetical protein